METNNKICVPKIKPDYCANKKNKIVDFAGGMVLGYILFWVIGYAGFFILFGLLYDSNISGGLGTFLIYFLLYGFLAALALIGMKIWPKRKFIFIGVLFVAALMFLLPGPCSIYPLLQK